MAWKDEFTRGIVYAMWSELRARHSNDGVTDDEPNSSGLLQGEMCYNYMMIKAQVQIVDMKTGLTYVHPEIAALLKCGGITLRGDHLIWIDEL